jgi:hypothetical protein
MGFLCMQITILNKLAKLEQLSLRDRKYFISSVILLPIINLALNTLGYHRSRAVLEKIIPVAMVEQRLNDEEILQTANEISFVVSIVAQQGFYKATCLRKTLLTSLFLRREGIQCQIFFGVRMNDRRPEAHAWLEYKGIVVNDIAEIREAFKCLR